MKGDQKLAEQARLRPSNGMHRGVIVNHNRGFECPYCGRHWFVSGSHHAGTKKSISGHGRPAGFVKSAAMKHVSTCAVATPEERRAIARLDEARWRRHPPAQDISNNHDHPGFGGQRPESGE